MPFTPYHFGPPLLIISIAVWYRKELITDRNKLWIGLSLLYGAVIPDLQGFYAIFFDRSVPLHGFSHTIIGAMTYALLTGLVLLMALRLNPPIDIPPLKSSLVILASIIVFHFVPDMFIWSDMTILWPLSERSFGEEHRYGFFALWMGRCFIVGLLVLSSRLVNLLQSEDRQYDQIKDF